MLHPAAREPADSTQSLRVLVADDEPNLRRVLKAQLEREGYSVDTAVDGHAALSMLEEQPFDVVITDLRMPRADGLDVLRYVLERRADVPVILLTAHGTVDTAVEALKLGAFDYVTKPFDRSEFRNVIAKAARARELSRRDASTFAASPGRFQLVGQSLPMREVYRLVDRVADTPSTVLITGESGTGKELVARALHDCSARRDQPFIRVNCAAIPSSLIESELFGYERGAFTGAVTTKPGRFELADRGTLFLDEIGEIPVNMQVKLLRAIQEQEFERVGGVQTLRVDVRLVAATNRDLRAEIEAGRFREDLYYRLNVVRLTLPALRERPEDIALLAEHFRKRFGERLKRPDVKLGEGVIEAFLSYAWPGNIRELENVIERCLLLCDSDRIEVGQLPEEIRGGSPKATVVGSGVGAERGGLKQAVRQATTQVERGLIQQALEQTGGNVTRAAQLLQISRKSLQNKMKELGFRAE